MTEIIVFICELSVLSLWPSQKKKSAGRISKVFLSVDNVVGAGKLLQLTSLKL